MFSLKTFIVNLMKKIVSSDLIAWMRIGSLKKTSFWVWRSILNVKEKSKINFLMNIVFKKKKTNNNWTFLKQNQNREVWSHQANEFSFFSTRQMNFRFFFSTNSTLNFRGKLESFSHDNYYLCSMNFHLTHFFCDLLYSLNNNLIPTTTWNQENTTSEQRTKTWPINKHTQILTPKI